jgi:hypothetical protein
MGVVGETKPANFGVHRGTARQSSPPLLQHEHRGAFSHDKAIAALIEGTAGVSRVFVSGRHGPNDGKRAEAEWGQRRLGTPRNHYVRFTSDDGAKCLSDGYCPRGTAHPVGGVGAGESELYGDVAARRPGKDGEGKRRIDRARATLDEVAVLLLPVGYSAERCAHHGADPIRILVRRIELGIAQRHPGGGDAELGEAVEAAAAPLLHVISGVEVVHLSSDARLEDRGIEPGDAADGRLPPLEALPQPLDSETDGRNGADPGDDYSPLLHGHLRDSSCFPSYAVPCCPASPPSSTYFAMPASVRDAMP